MTKQFKSINPYNNEETGTFTVLSDEILKEKLELSACAFREWRSTEMDERIDLIRNVSKLLDRNRDEYAARITAEMGKPITESRAEVEKCAWVCDYYAENAAYFLQPQYIETDGRESFIRYDPLGTIFAVMPWNYPFWQVFRFAVPTIMAGNAGLLKHATSVLGCAGDIEEIFRLAGFPEGLFQSLVITHEQAESVIESNVVKAVSLTGSEKAGSAVASKAAKHLKKAVLELGGSNAFVVFKDADLKKAIKTAVRARYQNTGQSCIAAKRFILVEDIYDEFMEGFLEKVVSLKAGDPADIETQIGPLARKDLADKLSDQVKRSVAAGARILTGGHQDGAIYDPTIITDVQPGMPVFDEEVFGPVAAVIRANDEAHAMELAGRSSFGLGMTLFTGDLEKAKKYAAEVEDGAFFINELVKSDPRLPFGGTKNSGFGRELAKDGILEFVNKKTVFVK